MTQEIQTYLWIKKKTYQFELGVFIAFHYTYEPVWQMDKLPETEEKEGMQDNKS